MPTRTQTSKRPAAGRRGRPAPSRRPTIATRRKPQQKSGVTKAVDRIRSMLPTSGQRPKRGAARGRSRKGPAGFALLAGATGLFMKNRAKRRRGDASTRAR